MKRIGNGLLVLGVIAGVAGAAYWVFLPRQPVPTSPEVRTVPTPSATPEPTSTIRYPIPSESDLPTPAGEAQPAKPVPPLDESDKTIQGEMASLIGPERFAALFINQELVRRIVVTVANATGRIQPTDEMLPVRSPQGGFLVNAQGDAGTIDPKNYERYVPYVALLSALDADKVVAVYVHYYSLFQNAYGELGTPGYFNDRLIELIDQVLGTPAVGDPIPVVRPSRKYRYKYADGTVENLSAAQKLIVRMGPKNAQAVQAKLQEIRSRLVKTGARR